MMVFRTIFFAFLMMFTLVPQVHAQEVHAQAPNDLVRLTITPERTHVQAGDKIWIAVEQTIKPQWHTYWKNPGDSGSVPRHEWSAPDGFDMGEIHWPTPDKIKYRSLANYGYSDRVVLLHPLSVPASLPDGVLEFKLGADVLVCKEECIPTYTELSFTLNDPSVSSVDNSSYIKQARAKLPGSVRAEDVATFYRDGDEFTLLIGRDVLGGDVSDLAMFPLDWGVVNNVASAQVRYDDDMAIITQKSGDRDLSDIDDSEFLVAWGDGVSRSARMLTASPIDAPTSVEVLPDGALDASQGDNKTTLLGALVLAFFGGLVLNLMPCVFPVLSMKALSLVKLSDKDRRQARTHGLVYTAGVMLSFLVIAGALIALKAGGAEIGWGFQLQNPAMIGALTYLLFIIGLNLSGYFEIPSALSNIGGGLSRQSGYSGSFFTGVLATIVATPCTAPFMAAAIGFALTQSAVASLMVFAMLGFGLAAPYLLLSFVPAVQRAMPKPGAWMETFRQFLAFPMFLTCAWLVWVLGNQAGTQQGVLMALIGGTLIAFGLWLYRITAHNNKRSLLVIALIFISFLLPIGLLAGSAYVPAPVNVQVSSDAWEQPYSSDALKSLLAGDDSVFVEMTADWCITCKLNHASSINIASTKQLFADNNVQYLVGDWTNQDAAITQYLQSYGRNGVPIYVFYGARDDEGDRPEAKLLPQILTPSIMKKFVTE